jgi:hypothetical protein
MPIHPNRDICTYGYRDVRPLARSPGAEYGWAIAHSALAEPRKNADSPMRTRIMNQLQALAMNEGQRRKKKLWNEQGRAQLERLPLALWASQAAVRCDADWRRRYMHLAMRRQRNIAKVAMARRLGVRLYWMWRNGWEYAELVKFGSNAGQLGTGHGVQ